MRIALLVLALVSYSPAATPAETHLQTALDTINNPTGNTGFIYYNDGGILFSEDGYWHSEVSQKDVEAVKQAAEAKGLPVRGYREDVAQNVPMTCYTGCKEIESKKDYYWGCRTTNCDLADVEKSVIRFHDMINEKSQSSRAITTH